MSAQGFAKKPFSAGAAAPTPAAAKPVPTSSFGSPTDGRIEVKPGADAVRRRAYELYTKRIAEGRPGDENADWLQAERELKR